MRGKKRDIVLRAFELKNIVLFDIVRTQVLIMKERDKKNIEALYKRCAVLQKRHRFLTKKLND